MRWRKNKFYKQQQQQQQIAQTTTTTLILSIFVQKYLYSHAHYDGKFWIFNDLKC